MTGPLSDRRCGEPGVKSVGMERSRRRRRGCCTEVQAPRTKVCSIAMAHRTSTGCVETLRSTDCGDGTSCCVAILVIRSKGGSARIRLDIGRDGAANTATMRLKRPYFLALAQPEMQENPEREGRGAVQARTESATGGRLRKSLGRHSASKGFVSPRPGPNRGEASTGVEATIGCLVRSAQNACEHIVGRPRPAPSGRGIEGGPRSQARLPVGSRRSRHPAANTVTQGETRRQKGGLPMLARWAGDPHAIHGRETRDGGLTGGDGGWREKAMRGCRNWRSSRDTNLELET